MVLSKDFPGGTPFQRAVWQELQAISYGGSISYGELASVISPSCGYRGHMPTIATIGVYEFDGAGFVRALDAAGVTLVVDIRQRRGVRGAQYAWANSSRLQERLAQARIGYEHHPELAPDTEMRHLQYDADARAGVGKRSREQLSPEYVQAYTEEILDLVPLEPLVRRLPVHGIGALLCVEATAQACHRSLVAERLTQRFGFEVVNLEPDLPPELDLT